MPGRTTVVTAVFLLTQSAVPVTALNRAGSVTGQRRHVGRRECRVLVDGHCHTGPVWRGLVLGLVLSSVLLCGCGTGRTDSAPQPQTRASSGTSPTTSPQSSAAAAELSLSDIFREEGVLLTGSAPSVNETLDFVAFFQYVNEVCDQGGHSGACPAMADADVVAQMYLEQHNQAAIRAHQPTAGT